VKFVTRVLKKVTAVVKFVTRVPRKVTASHSLPLGRMQNFF
jgi:hypothetical protein